MKKSILFGASGFIGSYLLDELLNDPQYDQVTIVVRKDLNKQHPKLKTLLGDYHSLPSLKDKINADDVFIALGTTKKKVPDQSKYYEIDHDYPVLAAKIAQEKGATSVFLVTSVGANANSNIFYVKTKGEAERDIIALNFQHTHIFRPSMILGNRPEFRPMEKLLIKLWGGINPLLIGKLDCYRGMDAKDIARAMMRAAQQPSSPKVGVYHWNEMKRI